MDCCCLKKEISTYVDNLLLTWTCMKSQRCLTRSLVMHISQNCLVPKEAPVYLNRAKQSRASDLPKLDFFGSRLSVQVLRRSIDFLTSSLGTLRLQSPACLKGQLISKCPFGVLKSSKKPTKFFPGLVSKKRSNQKNKDILCRRF